MAVHFCPQCGTQAVPQARFCAACGTALPGTGKPSSPPPLNSPPLLSWRSQLPGLTVLTSYLVIGSVLWLVILRSQPFPTVSGSSERAATGGSQDLPQNHPPIALPEEARQRIAELAEKAKAAPNDVTAWKTLADVQFRASQIDASYRTAALESFKHAFDLAPNDLDVLRGIGNTYYDLEDYPKAIEYYDKYLAQQPDDPGVRTDLGTMYLYREQLDRAIAEYQTVIDKNPEFFQAHFNLGVAYHQQGQVDKAQESLAKARNLTTDPTAKSRIDQVITQFGGTPPVTQTTSPSSTPVPPTQVAANRTLSPFQQAVEKVLREARIMGERINRIEWTSPTEARVLLQNFPMSAMPQEIRLGMVGKLQSQISELKTANKVSEAAKIELIDLDSQQVMETVNS
ncbi:MAG: tetratricopeptide repeat protein [Candidatus Binatia bacterium]